VGLGIPTTCAAPNRSRSVARGTLRLSQPMHVATLASDRSEGCRAVAQSRSDTPSCGCHGGACCSRGAMRSLRHVALSPVVPRRKSCRARAVHFGRSKASHCAFARWLDVDWLPGHATGMRVADPRRTLLPLPPEPGSCLGRLAHALQSGARCGEVYSTPACGQTLAVLSAPGTPPAAGLHP